jgi:glutathione transport system substrate-binding protein
MSNFGFFSSPEVDQLIQAGLASADSKVRGEAYAKLQEIIWPQAPWGYLLVDTLIAAKVKNLQGIYPLPDGAFSVEFAELTQ